jgi:hypothetical protein
MTFLWIFPAILYVACWVYVGLATFRRAHYWLFWIGFIVPDPVDRRGVHSPRPSAPPPRHGREIAQATSQTDHAETSTWHQPWVVT